MTVRMKDIATDLNLSKMTISKVLRGQMDVSDKTKARVLQRVKELNYRPNISARSFRTGQTFNVGLVLPSLIDPFFSQLAGSIVSQLRKANYSVFLSSTEYESDLEQRDRSASFQASRCSYCRLGAEFEFVSANHGDMQDSIRLFAMRSLIAPFQFGPSADG